MDVTKIAKTKIKIQEKANNTPSYRCVAIKIAKICDTKKLKTISWPKKFSNHSGGFLASEVLCQKLKKNSSKKFCKNAENCDVEKHSITFRNYTETYCQTQEKVPWLLRLAKPKKRRKFSKNLKKIAN